MVYRFWVSDEYGPYIYHFSGAGKLIQTIQPPAAILPRSADGSLNFTSRANPQTGRALNQGEDHLQSLCSATCDNQELFSTGFEGLTLDVETQTLYALLQSGTVQDGAGQFTRLLAYDIRDAHIRRPTLAGEWIVPLPTSASGKVLPASEVHFISEDIFLALARDSDGRAGDNTTSKYKCASCSTTMQDQTLLTRPFDRQADLVDISYATDIHNTKFDDPTNPIAVGGVLDPSITPAKYIPFVNYLNVTQLAKFGLHNGAIHPSPLLVRIYQ